MKPRKQLPTVERDLRRALILGEPYRPLRELLSVIRLSLFLRSNADF